MNHYVLNEVIGKQRKFDLEYKIINHKNGQERWVHGLGQLELDEKKQPKKLIGTISDITERKLAQESLVVSETRYRRLFESAKDGILILDAATGMIMDVNPFLIDMLGYSKERFIEKAIWEIGFFNDISANKENFLELQQKDYIRYEDLPIETADGNKIHVEFVSNVYQVNSHRVIQCNIRDITDRKLAEYRIGLSTKILNLLNSSTPFNETIEIILNHIQKEIGIDAVGIRFKNGIDYPYFIQKGFNQNFLLTENTLLGTNKDGLICMDKNGKPCLECTCGLVISGQTDSTNPLFTEGGSFWTNNSTVLLELTKEEEPRNNPRNRCIYEGFLSMALIPIRHNGEIVGLLQLNDRNKDRFNLIQVKFFESIGETIGVALMRKKTDDALMASETLYRNLVEKSLDGVYKSTHEGTFVEANPAMVRMLGYENKEELMTIDIKTQLYFDPVDRESMILQEMREMTGVYNLKKKDGSEIWVEDHGWYDYDKDGNIIFHEGILRDVTDRKKAEDEIQKLNETLEQRIIERTNQLENTNKRLEFHINELEQFGYITNHDLHEPIRTLLQFTDLLQEECSGNLGDDGKKYIKFIHNSALRMKDLVMDLREYSLLGKESIKSIIDCNRIVETVLSDLDETIKASNAKITVQNLPTLNGFDIELRLLFQNLIANAIKFQKEGKKPEINISAKNDGLEWIFKIEDNGIGIDPKYYDKVFIIFQRLHKRTEYQGTGIGLAHCKKIVELHGGKIWLESTPDIGSNFLFTIPKNNH